MVIMSYPTIFSPMETNSDSQSCAWHCGITTVATTITTTTLRARDERMIGVSWLAVRFWRREECKWCLTSKAHPFKNSRFFTQQVPPHRYSR